MHFHHRHDIAGCTNSHDTGPDAYPAYALAMLATLDRMELRLMTALQDSINAGAQAVTALAAEVRDLKSQLAAAQAAQAPAADAAALDAAVAAAADVLPAPAAPAAPVVEPAPAPVEQPAAPAADAPAAPADPAPVNPIPSVPSVPLA